jgi:hypothetical protein
MVHGVVKMDVLGKNLPFRCPHPASGSIYPWMVKIHPCGCVGSAQTDSSAHRCGEIRTYVNSIYKDRMFFIFYFDFDFLIFLISF